MKPVGRVSPWSPLQTAWRATARFMAGDIKRFISSRHLRRTQSQSWGAMRVLDSGFFLSAHEHLLMGNKSPPSLACSGLFSQGTNTHAEGISDLCFLSSAWSLAVHSSKGKTCLERGGVVSSVWIFTGPVFIPPWQAHVTWAGQWISAHWFSLNIFQLKCTSYIDISVYISIYLSIYLNHIFLSKRKLGSHFNLEALLERTVKSGDAVFLLSLPSHFGVSTFKIH